MYSLIKLYYTGSKNVYWKWVCKMSKFEKLTMWEFCPYYVQLCPTFFKFCPSHPGELHHVCNIGYYAAPLPTAIFLKLGVFQHVIHQNASTNYVQFCPAKIFAIGPSSQKLWLFQVLGYRILKVYIGSGSA